MEGQQDPSRPWHAAAAEAGSAGAPVLPRSRCPISDLGFQLPLRNCSVEQDSQRAAAEQSYLIHHMDSCCLAELSASTAAPASCTKAADRQLASCCSHRAHGRVAAQSSCRRTDICSSREHRAASSASSTCEGHKRPECWNRTLAGKCVKQVMESKSPSSKSRKAKAQTANCKLQDCQAVQLILSASLTNTYEPQVHALLCRITACMTARH